MTDDEIGALIAVVGLVSQLAGAVLLAGLFAALLRSHPRPQPYFRQWTLGWTALVVLRHPPLVTARGGSRAPAAPPTGDENPGGVIPSFFGE